MKKKGWLVFIIIIIISISVVLGLHKISTRSSESVQTIERSANDYFNSAYVDMTYEQAINDGYLTYHMDIYVGEQHIRLQIDLQTCIGNICMFENDELVEEYMAYISDFGLEVHTQESSVSLDNFSLIERFNPDEFQLASAQYFDWEGHYTAKGKLSDSFLQSYAKDICATLEVIFPQYTMAGELENIINSGTEFSFLATTGPQASEIVGLLRKPNQPEHDRTYIIRDGFVVKSLLREDDYLHDSLEISNFLLTEAGVSFTYFSSEAVGTAHLPPSQIWQQQLEGALSETSAEHEFTEKLGKHYLEIAWDNQLDLEPDVFMLDTTFNVWVNISGVQKLRPAVMSQTKINEEYPELTASGTVSLLLAYEPLFNVSIYLVPDSQERHPGVEPELLAFYEEYDASEPFVWAIDEHDFMHLSMEYVDAEGNEHMQLYRVSGQKFYPGLTFALDQADWN